MNEQIIKDKKVDKLNENLDKIQRSLSNVWLSLGKGLLYGFGTVLGAGIAIILIGWFLNVIGVIPQLKNTADDWKKVFQQTQNAGSIIQNEQPSNNP